MEKQVAGLRVRIDRWECLGHGDCVSVAPEVFELDERNLSSFRPGSPDVERARVVMACDVCPTRALAVFDEDGRRLVP